MSNVALSIVCFIIECIVLLFVILSLCLDVLRGKNVAAATITIPPVGGKTYRNCFSMWGTKRCGAHKTNPNKAAHKGFPSKKIEQIANAAGAFSVISLVVVLVAVILTALVMCKCLSAMAAVILYIVAVITIIISIGCLLGVYYIHVDKVALPGVRVKTLYTLGDATGIFVTGWCLQVINLILMIVNECCL